jgi:hypothetical protein
MSPTVWKTSTLVLAGALAYVVGTSGNDASAEPQPHMKEALETLRAARAQLDKANPDKGGHRVKAIALTDQAIDEVKAGIEFDDTHKGDKHDASGDAASPQ